MVTALQRERKTTEILRSALAQADAETVALADAFRLTLESQGMAKVTAALVVQEVIDSATPRGE